MEINKNSINYKLISLFYKMEVIISAHSCGIYGEMFCLVIMGRQQVVRLKGNSQLLVGLELTSITRLPYLNFLHYPVVLRSKAFPGTGLSKL